MKTHAEEIPLLDYWRVLLKRRSIALTFFLVVVCVVAVYSFLATPVYRGTAQILIDLEKNPVMTFSETGGGAYIQMKDASEYYRTQIEILTSRAFGDRVVRKLQLDGNPYFQEQKERGGKGLIRKMKGLFAGAFPPRALPTNPIPLAAVKEEADPELTDAVLKNMHIEIGKGSNILKIHYESENPAVATAMANGIAAAYIEHNLDIRVKPFRNAVEWLSARMVESRSRVEESEKVVQRYKEKKGIVSFETKENVITQKLQELTTQLVQAESKRQEAEVRYKQIQSVIEHPDLLETVPDIMNNLVIQGLRTDQLSVLKKISDLSEKYGPRHPQLQRAKTELDTVQKNLSAEARKMLNAARTEYDIARGRETSIRRTIEEQKLEVLDLGRKAIDYGVIAGEAVNNRQFYELLLKRLQEASLSSGISVSNAQIVDSATVPDRPVKPKRGLNLLLAMIVGALGGAFAAFFTEYIDDTIKTPEDVEKFFDLPFLGSVPAAAKEEGPLYLFSDARASLAEAFRSVRTGIMLSSVEDKNPQVMLATSSTPNEGKTTTAANLAVAMAQLGERVLLIDTDMRRHNLHNVFMIDNAIGISDLIMDHARILSAIKTPEQMPNLSVITGGTLAPNPSELLGSRSMRELLARFRNEYDRIILDSPPFLAFSDPLVLARMADGVLLVVRAGVTSRSVVKKTAQALTGVNGKILGVVLNNVSASWASDSCHYYPQYESYSPAESAGQKSRG